jgi:hypothetical protein
VIGTIIVIVVAVALVGIIAGAVASRGRRPGGDPADPSGQGDPSESTAGDA